MKLKVSFIFVLCTLYFISCSKNENIPEPNADSPPEGMYFPPIEGTTWETVTPAQLKWNENKIQDLYDYLDTKKTKGFIVLKDGRIAMEHYANGHNASAKWTWFSAAKSLTATFVGIAQDEGLIDINSKTSDYLGNDWSSLASDKQDLITVKHHLSMSTGLTDNVGDFIPWICTQPACLKYTADAGDRWAYHQGAFMLLQEMISKNTGMSFQEYCKEKVANKIGMTGNWSTALGLNIYNSSTRDMARFGLLTQNKGSWNGTAILSETYFNEMINTSQDINPSYGYLWWLNGKESHMGTNSQSIVQGQLIPNAPNDLIAALGAQDQKIYVIPSKNMVVVRCGESGGDEQLGLSSFDNELWGHINAVID